ncbi:MAG: iron ABC transporter permease [Gammaproteobacteria bacterium]|jgi:iron complex transport system permease protein
MSARSINFALAVGIAAVSLVSVLVGRTSGGPAFGLGSPDIAATVFYELRLPRTLLGLLVGGSLGVCGAALQGLLRNPLAEPGILGTSSSAALGAVIVFYFGLASQQSLLLPGGAILGSIAALGCIYGLAGRRAGLVTIVLTGIAINAFAAALTSLALNFAPSPYAALEILFWMLGSLADRELTQVAIAGIVMVPGWILIARSATGLDALTLGEETSQSLGLNPKRTRALVLAGTALSVGAGVAAAGVVGFVGLVVPHIMRGFIGYLPSRLLLPAFLGGALLTVLADIVIRLLPAGPELKLGVVTALIGAPFFLRLIAAARRGALQ